MTILVNQSSLADKSPYPFLIRFNASNGNLEFVSKGTADTFVGTLVERPYLDRWYHAAVVKQNDSFGGYLDGRQVFTGTKAIGSAVGSGLSIGGWGSGRYLSGEVQEVAIYQEAVSPSFIRRFMFVDQPADSVTTLRAYFKLGYSTNSAATLTNSAASPPSGTTQLTANGSGNVVFEETDQSGEQSVFDSHKNRGENALAPLSGSFSWEQTVLSRPTPGIALDFRLGYQSGTAFSGTKLGDFDAFEKPPLGSGWRHSFEVRLLPGQYFDPTGTGTKVVGLMNWNGGIETWDRDSTDPRGSRHLTRHKEYRGELSVPLSNAVCEWITPERIVYRFRHPFLDDNEIMQGRLVEVRDFNSNSVKVLWNEVTGVITQVVDTAGGKFDFHQSAAGLLTNVVFGSWAVNFSYDSSNHLTTKSIIGPTNYAAIRTSWQFQYSTNNLLERVIDPGGFTNIFVEYDRYGRKTNQTDALGRSTKTEYGAPGKRQMRHTDPNTNQWIETYDRKGHILAQRDPLGNTTRYTYDDHGNRTSITEPLGWTTFFEYDDHANVITRTNALGEVTRWAFDKLFNKATNEINPLNWTNFYAYDGGGNLTSHSDVLGSLVTYTYSTNGLVLSSTDANGNITRFGYDTNGFLIARTDPATNTWQFIANEVGWRLAEINPLRDRTSFAYDLNGNLVQTIDPRNRVFTRQWDANGNLIAQSDGKGQFTRYAYDAANQRVATTNRAGNVWLYSFTPRGKPERVTDPLTNTSTSVYDAANRLIAVSDPLGNSITNQYDANGNLVALFDTLGQRWSKTYDRLNRLVAEIDPLGDARQTTYDPAGRIKTITTPNGFTSLHEYDGRGRLVKWTDPQKFPWVYDYDGNGNITNITDALGGHYGMTYGPRNERTSERNQDGFEWQYTYDQLLRLKTQLDPNGILRTRKYDPASRLTSVVLSTGREDTYDPDDNDNPRSIVRRVNDVAVATTKLTYDALDRVTNVVDPNIQTVDYSFDPLGRVIAITYPGGRTLANRYDALGRLTNQLDWAGRQMTYSYDKAGRLIRRTYPNGVVQAHDFDTAGRLIGLSHASLDSQPSSINIALTYAYDRNGNKTGSSEKGTLEWPLPALTDETANYKPSGRLIDRQVKSADSIDSQSSTFNHSYDPSGNMTNAVRIMGGADVESWSLTYDEDNRTTSLLWTTNRVSKLITNHYDALGRRIARDVDGKETRYVLDLSGSMERILCDLNPDGTTNWYVHGPDLAYVERPDGSIQCFHADATANVIALTGTNGTLLAQYAYTPYGRSLGSTNLQSQFSNPYLFVGSQGVMEELPGLYFMRARYYSADAGTFLSTDPMKKIGPGWKPAAYAYAAGNPLFSSDPSGNTLLNLSLAIVFTGAAALTGHLNSFALNPLEHEYAGPNYPVASLKSLNEFNDYVSAHPGISLEDRLGYIAHDRGNLAVNLTSGLTDDAARREFYGNDRRLAGNLFVAALVQITFGGDPWAALEDGLVATTFLSGRPARAQAQAYRASAGMASQSNVSALKGPVKDSGNGSLSSRTVAAAGVGSAITAASGTQPISPSGASQTGTWLNGNQGNRQTGNQNATTTQSTSQQQPSSNSTSFVSQVGAFISNVATSVGNFFGGLFGGGHRP